MAIKLYSTIIAATLLCTSHPATADANIKQLQRKLIEFGYDAGVEIRKAGRAHGLSNLLP